jgi:aspartate-semialdehyde dehydrogenase
VEGWLWVPEAAHEGRSVTPGGYRVGVLGATGAVGTTILEVLAARRFPAREVVPFASESSAGRRIEFAGEELECRPLSPESIEGLDLVLSSAGGSVSAEWAPRLVQAGAVVVDNTSYWRMHDDVPLVVSEVNPDAVEGHNGLIANPNCTTMQMVVALAPIQREVGIERLVVSTYQSVSGTGRRAIEELEAQARAVLAGKEPAPAEVYPHQIAFNVLPQVETFKDGDDYTTEERKVMRETRKILGVSEDELRISATCARVPVIVGHAESVNLELRRPFSAEECRELLSGAQGVSVVDAPGDGLYPLPTEVAGRDDVLVGRIRRDPSHERGLNLWVVGDNLRKGAATNAVQVAEVLHERDLIRVPAGAASFV